MHLSLENFVYFSKVCFFCSGMFCAIVFPYVTIFKHFLAVSQDFFCIYKLNKIINKNKLEKNYMKEVILFF